MFSFSFNSLPLPSGSFEITAPGSTYLGSDSSSLLTLLMETLLVFFPEAASLYVYNARIFLAIQHHHSHHSLFLFYGHSMMLLGTAKLQVSSFITHAVWRLSVYWLYTSSSRSGHRPRNHSLMRPEKSKKHLSLVYPMISWFRLSCVCDINYLNPHLRLLTSLAVWASLGMLSERVKPLPLCLGVNKADGTNLFA